MKLFELIQKQQHYGCEILCLIKQINRALNTIYSTDAASSEKFKVDNSAVIEFKQKSQPKAISIEEKRLYNPRTIVDTVDTDDLFEKNRLLGLDLF